MTVSNKLMDLSSVRFLFQIVFYCLCITSYLAINTAHIRSMLLILLEPIAHSSILFTINCNIPLCSSSSSSREPRRVCGLAQGPLPRSPVCDPGSHPEMQPPESGCGQQAQAAGLFSHVVVLSFNV